MTTPPCSSSTYRGGSSVSNSQRASLAPAVIRSLLPVSTGSRSRPARSGSSAASVSAAQPQSIATTFCPWYATGTLERLARSLDVHDTARGGETEGAEHIVVLLLDGLVVGAALVLGDRVAAGGALREIGEVGAGGEVAALERPEFPDRAGLPSLSRSAHWARRPSFLASSRGRTSAR